MSAVRRRSPVRLAALRVSRPRRSVALIGVVLLVAFGSGFALGAVLPSSADPLAADYPRPLIAAADALVAATAPDASGYTFEVVQRQVMRARPGGPRVPVPDPADQTRTLRLADAWYVGGVTSRGAVTPNGFWMEMRAGPGESQPPAFDTAAPLRAVIERDGHLWRTNGAGWFETDASPGQGMDPLTAARLPLLLRRLGGVHDLGSETIEGVTLHRYAGIVDTLNDPGIAASDGFTFTSPEVPVELWLDAANHLVRLRGTALNLNMVEFDLVIDTMVTFDYAAPGAPPEPVPTLVPSPALP